MHDKGVKRMHNQAQSSTKVEEAQTCIKERFEACERWKKFKVKAWKPRSKKEARWAILEAIYGEEGQDVQPCLDEVWSSNSTKGRRKDEKQDWEKQKDGDQKVNSKGRKCYHLGGEKRQPPEANIKMAS